MTLKLESDMRERGEDIIHLRFDVDAEILLLHECELAVIACSKEGLFDLSIG
jgi:hypothetical protein